MARTHIRQRARIFIAHEGKSEKAFCAWLQDLCDESHLHLHLVRPTGMSGGGDPLALVNQALDLSRRDKERAGRHRQSILLIDADRLDDESDRSCEAIRLAEREKLVLICQRPCFEGVLLRLYKGYERVFPDSARDAEHQLKQLWMKYCKPPTRQQLAARFRLSDLQRLARADEEIARLLQLLGLPTKSDAGDD